MVELVMSIFIFGIAITALTAGMSSSLNLTRQDRLRSVAANLASQDMDIVRSTSFTSLPLGDTITTQTVDSTVYTLTRQTGWVAANATSGPCQTTSGSTLAYLAVSTTVTWNDMNGTKPPQSNTVVAPPIGTYDPNNGHVAVTVLNANGTAQANIPVSLTGGSVNQTEQTTSDGCAFFGYIAPGAYTVTLNQTGLVSDQGVVAPTKAVTVAAGAIASIQMQYDTAATLSLTLSSVGGATLPTTPNIPLTLFNTHLLPSGLKNVAGSGVVTTVGNLFPYTDGYQSWAGTCSDADPQGLLPSGLAFYPGATRAAVMSVSPGGTTAGTVALHAMTVFTKNTATGLARPTIAVTATHVVPTGAVGGVDAKCTAGEVYTLGTTNASGLITVLLPYGTWKISAVGTANTVNQTLSPLVGSTPTATVSW